MIKLESDVYRTPEILCNHFQCVLEGEVQELNVKMVIANKEGQSNHITELYILLKACTVTMKQS